MRAGHIWFAVQGVLAAALLIAPVFSHLPLAPVWRALGVVLGLGGVALIVASYRVLGESHSPWTEPAEGAALRTRGPYAVVRHPVYAGYVILGLGYGLALASPAAIVFAILCFIYYDLRTRAEDRALAQRYADFAGYRARVRSRLIPALY
jgi:protein-S-isoprenylcysteine O-methyltransferase Ste14